MSWVKRRAEFEKAAKRKGYNLDSDELGRYDDHYLQEAWSIFTKIDIEAITSRQG